MNLKLEGGDFNRFETDGELLEELYRMIYYYNHHRIHSKLKMPPTEYRLKHQNRVKLALDLDGELKNLIEAKFGGSPLARKFLDRIGQGELTRDENPETHFGVYFAGFDPKTKEVFVGLHKKSDLWLFNGGHIDRGETLGETLAREMSEEWGFVHPAAKISEPSLLTITEITNDGQICRRHYDIWYFAPVDKSSFFPDELKLMKEFHQIKWVNFDNARKLITDVNTLTAVDAINKLLT